MTGTVFVPSGEWQGSGERPVISYATGTHGLSLTCAPSKKFDAGLDYEAANIAAALERGYTVVVSDYPGYTNGSEFPYYLVGQAQANAAMDIVRAAYQIPGAGISDEAKVGIWGYSQGGQTAAWIGETMQEYAPELNIVGIAQGGVPGDFLVTADYLNGSTGMSFLLSAVLGLEQQYPDELPIDDYINANGESAIAAAKNQCVFESLFALINTRLSDYTQNGQSLQQLLDEIPRAEAVVVGQNVGEREIPVPVYQYHGQADEFIPLGQAYELKEKYCDLGTPVKFDLYPSEHIATQFQAAPYALDWMQDRFTAPAIFDVPESTYLTFAGTPVSTANLGGGDFVVTLDEWNLEGEIFNADSDDVIVLPEGSSFTGDTNISANTLSSNLTIPESRQKVTVLLPLDADVMISEVESTVGSVSLDNDGYLDIEGLAQTNIEVQSAGLGFIQIPLGCKTEEPMQLPLNFFGPISSLGNGNLAFKGETEIPAFRDCWVWQFIVNSAVAGPGQVYDIRITPPAPVSN